jgi:glycosyltransferase involved in cell wall biosynthesis
MNIGFDVAQTCQERAGCGWVADSLARAMVRVAHQHTISLYHHFGTWINSTVANGTIVDAPNVNAPLLNMEPTKAEKLWRDVASGHAKLPGEPDIVQCNSFQAPRIPGTRLVLMAYDVSFWIHPQFTTEANRLVCQRGMLEAIRRVDGILFISEHSRQEFEVILPGWLEERGVHTAIMPLAARFDPPSVPVPRENFWLVVGSLEPRKNHAILFKALELYHAASKDPKIMRVAGGRGWMSDQLHTTLLDLEEKGWVEYLDYVPDDELQGLYQKSFALVFPSWYEGFGLPVLEAMTCGSPVICSENSSLPEVGGEAPIYVPPDDAHRIAQAMLHLEQDPAEYERRQNLGRVQASQFSWDKSAQIALDFYSRILE